MAAIDGTYISNVLNYTLVIKNGNDDTGKCDAELFLVNTDNSRITFQVVAAHYHFRNGDASWGANTMLGLLAVGPSDNQELPFRAIVLRSDNMDFASFSGGETLSSFDNHYSVEEVYTRVDASDPRGAARRH